jgi:hypothetical protein
MQILIAAVGKAKKKSEAELVVALVEGADDLARQLSFE